MTHPAENTNSNPQHPLAISLFARIGGYDLGVTTGFEIGLAVEADSRTAIQYRVNFHNSRVLYANVVQASILTHITIDVCTLTS